MSSKGHTPRSAFLVALLGSLIIATLAIIGVSSPAQASSAPRSNPRLDNSVMKGYSWGEHPRVISHNAYNMHSFNWSGLVDVGSTFTSVAGAWTVPAVKPSQPLELSGAWVGIGGTTNEPLIQTGTSQESEDGVTLYQMWYEMLPAPPIYFADVSPGDLISASVSGIGPNTWRIYITDDSSGAGLDQVFS